MALSSQVVTLKNAPVVQTKVVQFFMRRKNKNGSDHDRDINTSINILRRCLGPLMDQMQIFQERLIVL